MKIFNLKKMYFLLGLLLLIDCSIGGYVGVWREWYWSSLEKRELYKWLWYVSQFIGLALLSCLVSGYSQYVLNITSLRLRTVLSKKALALGTYKDIEGGAQRVQEDCLNYPLLLLTLILGLSRSIIMLGVFTTIVVVQIGYWWLLLPIIYSLIGTVLAGKIAFPLINLNYLNQVVEAKFRASLTKLNYIDVHTNNYNLFRYSKYLQYFQSFYNQVTIIVPHLMLVSLYFTGRITFGIFMQVVSSIAELINSLSYLLNSFSDINRFLSCRKRLLEIGVINRFKNE